jgi:hypothetical protein
MYDLLQATYNDDDNVPMVHPLSQTSIPSLPSIKEEDQHDDPLADDIYEPLEEVKPVIDTAKPKLRIIIDEEKEDIVKKEELQESSAFPLPPIPFSILARQPPLTVKKPTAASLARKQIIKDTLEAIKGQPTIQRAHTTQPKKNSPINYTFNYERFKETVPLNDVYQATQGDTLRSKEKLLCYHDAMNDVVQLKRFESQAIEIKRKTVEINEQLKQAHILQQTQYDEIERYLKEKELQAKEAIDKVDLLELHLLFPNMFDDDAPTRSPTPAQPPKEPVVRQRTTLKPGLIPAKTAIYVPPIYTDRIAKNQHQYLAWDLSTETYEWTSIHKPRPEYQDRKCNLCGLRGHIQWNCPDYICRHCKKNCGHVPRHCPMNPINHYPPSQSTAMFCRIETNPLFSHPLPKKPPSYEAVKEIKKIEAEEEQKSKRQKTQLTTTLENERRIENTQPTVRPRTARMHAAPAGRRPQPHNVNHRRRRGRRERQNFSHNNDDENDDDIDYNDNYNYDYDFGLPDNFWES